MRYGAQVVTIHDVAMALDYVLDLCALADGGIPVVGGELRGGSFMIPVENGVVVQRKAVHLVAHAAHHGLRPRVVVIVGAAANLVEPIAAEALAEGSVTAIEVGVIIGRHVAAASPRLVAHAE